MTAAILWQSLVASLVGGILSLDRTAALQIMVSRPIVAAPVVGYFLGDPKTGLFIGAALELLWLGELPVGGHIPAHEVMLAVLVTAIALIGGEEFNGSDASMSVFLGFTILMVLPMDILCKRADRMSRNFNARFFESARADLERGVQSVVINNLKGLVVFFALNFLLLFGLTVVGVMILVRVLPALPSAVTASLPLVLYALVIVGITSSYNAVCGRKSLPVFLATTLVGLVVFLMVYAW